MKQLLANRRQRREAARALRKERQEAIEQAAREEAGQILFERQRIAFERAQLMTEVNRLVDECVELRHSETHRMYDLHLDYLPGYGFIYMRLSGDIVMHAQGQVKIMVRVGMLDVTALTNLKRLLTIAQTNLQAHKVGQLD